MHAALQESHLQDSFTTPEATFRGWSATTWPVTDILFTTPKNTDPGSELISMAASPYTFLRKQRNCIRPEPSTIRNSIKSKRNHFHADLHIITTCSSQNWPSSDTTKYKNNYLFIFQLIALNCHFFYKQHIKTFVLFKF
jgi:hypothetical protein